MEFWNALFYLSAVFSGLFLIFVMFMLSVPLFVHQFVNNGGGDTKSGFHLFTFLEEGKAKIIIRGETPVRAIMNFADHRFKRVGERTSAKYWEVVDIQKIGDLGFNSENDRPEKPYRDCHWFVRPWAAYVYRLTGAVFTGIYPFQRVHEYRLERTKIIRKDGEIGGLASVEDISDHFRVRNFLYPILVPSADTLDKISLKILVTLVARITNPYSAAFGIDHWDQKLVNEGTDAISNFARTRNLEDVMSAKDAAKALELKEAIKKVGDDTIDGFDMVDADINDISPNLNDEEKARLYAEALAKPVAAATKIDGKARADVLRDLNEANAAGGEFALATLTTEAQVRMAKESKGGTTLFVGGTNDSNAAILATLQKINETLKKGA